MIGVDLERQTMLADMAGGVFAELGPQADFARDWSRIEELGFAGLLLPEESGGFGGTWSDALVVFRLAGQHALALPLCEAVIVAKLAQATDFAGLGSLAQSADGSADGDTWSGTLTGIPWGRNADYVIAPASEGCSLAIDVRDAEIGEGTGLSGEPRDTIVVEAAQAVPIGQGIRAFGAAARAMQIAGALEAALEMAANYVGERQQFGRPLAKFQAVQQSLAQMAMEAAAANCAAFELARALDRGDADFEIDAAKTRTGMAAGTGTALAHQVHGAIGFTQEYALHHLTRRLLAWRSEFGGEAHWSLKLGTSAVDAGADRLWPDLVARTDP